MKAVHFLNRNGIEPYFQNEKVRISDISTLFKAWCGIISNFVNFKHTVNDHERIYFLGHIYSYLGEIHKFLRLDWDVNVSNRYVPNMWYDIKEIERIIGLCSRIFHDWLVGGEFESEACIHNLDKLQRYLTDLCICLDIRPEDVLYLYHEAYPLTTEDIKIIKLVRPTYRRVGRPSRKEQAEHDVRVKIEDFVDYPKMKMGSQTLTPKPTKAQRKRKKVHAGIFREQKRMKEHGGEKI